jgi:hypothetical protein
VSDKLTQINITMEQGLLKRIDEAAARCGMTWSASPTAHES